MIYFFTGAGVSADSGIPTFRDAGGLWEQFRPEEVCGFSNFMASADNRKNAFAFHNKLKNDFRDAKPNEGHYAIADLEKRMPVTVYTTNVDMLHEQAGSSKVIHLHGSMTEMNCTSCGFYWDIGAAPFEPCDCPACGGSTGKPGGVFFGELAPRYHDLMRSMLSMTSDDILIIVGTSLMVVNPISMLRRLGKFGIPRIMFVDKNLPYEVTLPGVEGYQGPSAEVLPKLLVTL